MKPTLFLNPEGTLLVDGEHPDHYLEARVAPFAGDFLAWATKHFHVRWLTDLAPNKAFYLAEKLGRAGHEIPYCSFSEARSSAIEPRNEFFWVDTHLTPMDVSWLAQHGKADRFLAVNPVVGVTDAHKSWLSDKLNSKRK